MEYEIICPSCEYEQKDGCEIICDEDCDTILCTNCHEPFYIINYLIIKGHKKDCGKILSKL